MSFDYTRPRATAERLIARFGKAGAIRRSARTDTPDTPWDPSDDTLTVTDYACTLVVTDYSAMERTGTLIGTTDRKVLVSTEGLGITPLVSDLLVVDGQAYEIKTLMPLQPGETVVMWNAQVVF